MSTHVKRIQMFQQSTFKHGAHYAKSCHVGGPSAVTAPCIIFHQCLPHQATSYSITASLLHTQIIATLAVETATTPGLSASVNASRENQIPILKQLQSS